MTFRIACRLSAIGILCIFIASLAAAPVGAAEGANPVWSPPPTDRLVKLPESYLRKSLERDFADSDLGQALSRTVDETGLKTRTLEDLTKAVDAADGPVRSDLQVELLGEKRAFIQLTARKNALARKHLDTKRRLLGRLLARLDAKSAAETPGKRALIEKQEAARARFESSLAKVDLKLFDSGAAAESRYGRAYAKNRGAIEQLLAKINAHPLADGDASVAGAAGAPPATRKQMLRGLLSETQADLALLDQEDVILGYMARLVALDAMILAEATADAEFTDGDRPAIAGAAAAVGLFVGK